MLENQVLPVKLTGIMPSQRCYTPNSPHIRESAFQNMSNFCLQNQESWASESEIQLKESRIPLKGLESRIQVPLAKTGIQYLVQLTPFTVDTVWTLN